MANELTIEQCATLLNSVVTQATGRTTITPTNTAEFVTVAQTALKTGYDPIMNAISQVLSKTIFSVRPYSAKFKSLKTSPILYGNHVRKLKIADAEYINDQKYEYPVAYDSTKTPASGNGESVDMYTIKKPSVFQTNFYGKQVFSDFITIFRDQIDTAFTGPEQFGSFVSMVMTNMSDRHEQGIEALSRVIITNFIAGIIDADQDDRVIHLLTEYNAMTGLSMTDTTVYEPDNFRSFIQWVYARLNIISEFMTERSIKYQTNITAWKVDGEQKYCLQHTPKERQKVYLYAPLQYYTQSMTLANTYHDEYLKGVKHETINYWQSIDTPDQISITPGYIGEDGTAVTGDAVTQSNVFGIIVDDEAMGFCEDKYHVDPTPFNAAGEYTNMWMHSLLHCYNDHTEKGVVLLLD